MNSARPQLPRGARELMPAQARARRALVSQVLDVARRFGFAEVMTPMVEYADIMTRGMSEAGARRAVRFIEPGTGEVVSLRSDMTPQVARMVAARLGGELPAGAPVRLSYAGNLVRTPDKRRAQTEYHQVGVELIGDGSAHADAEIIALCDEVLRELGLAQARIDLSHSMVARGLLQDLALSADGSAALRFALARKDEGAVVEALAAAGADPALTRAVVELCGLFGGPEVVEKARGRLGALPGVMRALEDLQGVLDALAAVSPGAFARAQVDLGEVRGFDYYTGVRLRVWSPGTPDPIGGGGRYDDLMQRYGKAAPATGFAFDLDAVGAALADEAPESLPVVVVASPAEGPRRVEAAKLAASLRGAGKIASVCAGLAQADAVRHAEALGAAELIFLLPVGERRFVRQGKTLQERSGDNS